MRSVSAGQKPSCTVSAVCGTPRYKDVPNLQSGADCCRMWYLMSIAMSEITRDEAGEYTYKHKVQSVCICKNSTHIHLQRADNGIWYSLVLLSQSDNVTLIAETDNNIIEVA